MVTLEGMEPSPGVQRAPGSWSCRSGADGGSRGCSLALGDTGQTRSYFSHLAQSAQKRQGRGQADRRGVSSRGASSPQPHILGFKSRKQRGAWTRSAAHQEAPARSLPPVLEGRVRSAGQTGEEHGDQGPPGLEAAVTEQVPSAPLLGLQGGRD